MRLLSLLLVIFLAMSCSQYSVISKSAEPCYKWYFSLKENIIRDSLKRTINDEKKIDSLTQMLLLKHIISTNERDLKRIKHQYKRKMDFYFKTN